MLLTLVNKAESLNIHKMQMKYLAVASQNPHRLQQRLRLLLKNPSLEPWDQRIIEDYIKLVGKLKISSTSFNITIQSLIY